MNKKFLKPLTKKESYKIKELLLRILYTETEDVIYEEIAELTDKEYVKEKKRLQKILNIKDPYSFIYEYYLGGGYEDKDKLHTILQVLNY